MLLNVCVTAVPLIAALFPVNVTVPLPGVNVPPLSAQFPATAMAAAVPASNVPAVSVIAPFKVKVVVLPPTLSVCPVLFTTRLLNVCVTAVPLIAWAAVVLLNVTVLAAGVNVPPLFVQSPATVTEPARVTAPVASIWKLPKVTATVGVIVVVPVNVVVDPVRSNVPLVFVTFPLNAIDAAPLEVNVELPPFCVNAPEKVIVPVDTVIAQPLF